MTNPKNFMMNLMMPKKLRDELNDERSENFTKERHKNCMVNSL
jgi:hypothetical protein